MLLPEFMQSLPSLDDSAYVVAVTEHGEIYGSVYVDGINQTSISVWGDDSSTQEIDGALAGESISFQLISGDELYQIIDHSSNFVYETNAIISINNVSAILVDCSTVYGCIHDWANNYNPLATADDGSCHLYGCLDIEAFNYNVNVTHEDNSCLFNEFFVNQLTYIIDSQEVVSNSYESEIVNLSNQLL